MTPTPHADEADTRHRLLEGVLLRLARLPDADAFVLRGGMLLRHWFRPRPRTAGDLDLVATFPFDIADTRRRLAPLLADDADDGVRLDPRRYRVEGIWLNIPFPGVRVFACGTADGVPGDFSVDITFGEPLVPAPVGIDYPVGGRTARLRACRPETIVGRKLHALHHMGMLHWRPKDLHDLRLLLTVVPLDAAELPAAVAASFASRGDEPALAATLFGRPWWALKRTAARWGDFVREGRGVPADLRAVVAEVGGLLAPVLEALP